MAVETSENPGSAVRPARPAAAVGLALVGLLALAATPARADGPYDVVVYGATPAGLTAAVAAARAKASVVVIEPGRHIGGAVAGGLSCTDTGNVKTIGGLCLEYFTKASRRYGPELRWDLEPHAYQETFDAWVREAGFRLLTGRSLANVRRDGARIVAVTLDDGSEVAGKVFVDATYEGDLMARAGVPYVVGREGRAQYGEPLAGYYPMPIRPRTVEVMSSVCACLGGKGPHYIHGTPARIPARRADGTLLAGVEPAPEGLKPGDPDDRTQSYNFRLCVTRDPANRVPFPEPAAYDPARYELLLALLRAYPEVRFGRLFHLGRLPNGKFDLNAAGLFSTDMPGANTAYPNGDAATRSRIRQDHVDYTQGLFWFLGHDARVPPSLRGEANEWGVCRDEFADNGFWPYQLYVREGRRMVGAYVMTQKDEQTDLVKPDAVAMGSFVIDCHIVRRIVDEHGDVTDEGSFPDAPARPYQIPYRSLTPRAGDCANLLVPVCLSASHVAYCSLRMEPVYMSLGHASGLAAVQAVRRGRAVQDVDAASLRDELRRQGQVLELPASVLGPSSASLPGVVVDDAQATFTGDWTATTFGVSVDGLCRHDQDAGKGAKTARYRLSVPRDGSYEVRLSYTPAPNRATNVPVVIEHADGSTAVRVDQRRKPPLDGLFVRLGTYRFVHDHPGAVVIGTEGTDGHVVADAVQLLPVGR